VGCLFACEGDAEFYLGDRGALLSSDHDTVDSTDQLREFSVDFEAQHAVIIRCTSIVLGDHLDLLLVTHCDSPAHGERHRPTNAPDGL
jgi:hypothetical protein